MAVLCAPIAVQAQVVIWNNGSFATGTVTRGNGSGGPGVTAPAGTQWSELADGNGNGGSSAHPNPGFEPAFRIEDDFTLGGATNISQIHVFGYSPNANPSQGFSNGNLRIWSGRPGDAGSTVVFGDTSTNVVVSSAFTNIYRVFGTTSSFPGATLFAPGTTRPVQDVTMSVGMTLPAGTYWLDWQLSAVVGTTAFSPFVTFSDGVTRGPVGANARQQVDAITWQDVVDTGNPQTLPDVAQELPFTVIGTPVPEPTSLALLGVGAIGFTLRRWRKR
jgi:hypothetical protein